MGIKTVAVYSEVDRDALHVRLADEAICIGPVHSSKSYLNMNHIISATILTGAQAIHPGFGFLSENSKFARLCRECNITFIGPTPETIDQMGNKAVARETMMKINVPVVPGSEGIIHTEQEAFHISKKIGYPVLVKASAGGGGRGMRIAYNEEELEKAFRGAKSEALSTFGDDSIYIEKYLQNPRHIEFQILGDSYGNVVHLWERDCSLQRRKQKVIEEAPSSALDENLRKKMGDAAIQAAKAVHYINAGTMEFLVDKNDQFYFIEMNTRIQVEHPVTEMITGIDLIKEQIKIASGQALSIGKDDIKKDGYAIECRINAENPSLNFRPSPGVISNIHLPGGPGIRIDGALYNGYRIPSSYDSMIAKLIAHGKDRKEAIARMKRALQEMIIEGINTNIDFLLEIMEDESYMKGIFDTGFIENELLGNRKTKGVKNIVKS